MPDLYLLWVGVLLAVQWTAIAVAVRIAWGIH